MKKILKALFGRQYGDLFLFFELVPTVYNEDIFRPSLYIKSLKNHFYSFEKQITLKIDFTFHRFTGEILKKISDLQENLPPPNPLILQAPSFIIEKSKFRWQIYAASTYLFYTTFLLL